MACPRCGQVHKPWQCGGVTKSPVARHIVPAVTKSACDIVTPSLSSLRIPAAVHEALSAELKKRLVHQPGPDDVAVVPSRGRGRPRKSGPVSASAERMRRMRARKA